VKNDKPVFAEATAGNAINYKRETQYDPTRFNKETGKIYSSDANGSDCFIAWQQSSDRKRL
jgi:hypothetical protein